MLVLFTDISLVPGILPGYSRCSVSICLMVECKSPTSSGWMIAAVNQLVSWAEFHSSSKNPSSGPVIFLNTISSHPSKKSFDGLTTAPDETQSALAHIQNAL